MENNFFSKIVQFGKCKNIKIGQFEYFQNLKIQRFNNLENYQSNFQNPLIGKLRKILQFEKLSSFQNYTICRFKSNLKNEQTSKIL